MQQQSGTAFLRAVTLEAKPNYDGRIKYRRLVVRIVANGTSYVSIWY